MLMSGILTMRNNAAMNNESEVPVYICSHIFDNSRPVLLVSKADGEWQMLCGSHHDANELPHVVGINHLLERDPSLTQVMDLQDDWEAERESVGDSWVRTKCDPENY